MKVSELVTKTQDKIILYKEQGEEFIDIFNGLSKEIPDSILLMEISVFGSKRKGVLDIQVR